jgi:hypothetical protein
MHRSSRVSPCAGYGFRWIGARVWSLGPIRCSFIVLALLCMMRASFADIVQSRAVPFHLARGFAVIIPVTVNGRGPYDFMLDTGASITAIDGDLSRELALEPEGQGTVTTLTQQLATSLAIVKRVDFGPIVEQNIEVMIRDLNGLHRIAPTARGVLGQNALNHADFLLDYQHKLLQFDNAGELVRQLDGHHVALHRDAVPGNAQYASLAIHARVSDNGIRAIDLLLDSGAASPVIFDTLRSEVAAGYPTSFITDTSGQQLLAGVRNLQLTIDGKLKELVAQVLVFNGADKNVGGLLPTRIFSRIYISNTGGFAILEPKRKKLLDQMVAGLSAAPPVHRP